MLLTTIKKQNIYTQVIEHLKRFIIENRLQPGDRLPTEAELSEQLGVSRLSIREALKVMESLGIVQTKPRDGSRLMSLTMKPMTEHLRFLLEVDGVTFAEIARARLVLENAILPAVIESAGEDDLLRLEALIEQMREQTKRGKSIVTLDMEFHQTLAAATKNRALEAIGVMVQQFFLQLGDPQEFREEQWKFIEEHEALCRAIRARDAAAAQAIMAHHLSFYDKLIAAVSSR